MLAGCLPPARVPREVTPPPRPAFDKTFGEATPEADRLSIQYRNLQVNTAELPGLKGLAPGRRMLLKKDEGFLFVSRAPAGYLLEFDNGRNIYVGEELPAADALRPFVYELRDDGKEITLAFIPAAPEERLAEIIGLLQPKIALIVQSAAGKRTNAALLRRLLQVLMFSGELYLPAPGEKIPF